METETKTRATITLQRFAGTDETAVRDLVTEQIVLALNPDDLAVIVQHAYDEHGILADPSYDVEAERALDEPIPYTLEETLEAKPEPGRCPCGMSGCSDRGYVDEYRDMHQVGQVEL